MEPLVLGLLGVVVMVLLLMMGLHVGAAMLTVGFLGYLAVSGNVGGSLGLLATTPYNTAATYAFSVLPLFILMGHFAFQGGISQDLYTTAYKWMGGLPGGLAIATTWAAAAFGAACGSSLASAATFTRISLPEMLRYGYDRKLASGCIAVAGTLAIMIPPSAAMVIYGIITGSNIGRLLIAGFIPGIISAAVFMMVVIVRVKMNPALAPQPAQRFGWGERLVALKGVWGILALLLLVMGGIYTGVFTPTEAGAVGAFGAFLIAFVRGGLKGGHLKQAMLESGQTTAMIFFIIIGAMVFGRFLAISRVGPEFTEFITGLSVPPIVIILGFMVMYIFLGMIMDAVAMMAITLPVVFPVVMALGYSDIWFGILIVKVVEIGMVTPPVGMNCYVVASVAGDQVKLEDVFRGVLPFVIGDSLTLSALIAFPVISLWLPGKMLG